MKQYLFITGMVAILLAGCQQGQVKVSERTFSDETSEYRISAKHAIFSSTDEKVNQACQEMNQAVAEYVESATEQFRTEATGMRRELAADDMKCPVWVSEFHLEDSVFMATSQYISMRLTIYTYNGGAHGQTRYMAFNYDVKNGRFLTNEDIVDASKATAVNAQLKAHFQNPNGCFTEDPTLEQTAVINFTATSLCFKYEPYVLGPYACGAAEVNVPREALKDALRIL